MKLRMLARYVFKRNVTRQTAGDLLFKTCDNPHIMPDDDDDDDDWWFYEGDVPDIFISHSSQDAALARQIVDLLRSGLNLRGDRIRCTSVDGYRLASGVDTEHQLRKEALNARVVIGILSAFSLASAYVLFELGARWGAGKPLIPLLAPGMGPQALRGPLTSINALSCDSSSQLHQLVGDVAAILGLETENAAVYQYCIDSIIYAAHTVPSAEPLGLATTGGESQPSPATPAQSRSITDVQPSTVDDYSDAKQVIARYCEREWPDDSAMRSYCISRQLGAIEKLRKSHPDRIPAEVFSKIRQNCARAWPDDYSMRQYSEQKQFAEYREVHQRTK